MNATKPAEKISFINIDIVRILKALWKRKIVIMAVSVLCAIVFTVINYMNIVPVYQSDILMYVNNNSISLGETSFSINAGQLAAARAILDTYMVLLRSRSALDAIIKKADLPYSREALKSMITAGSVEGTEVFAVQVTSTDPEESRIIANSIAEVLPDILTRTIKGSSVEIIDFAIMPQGSVPPDITGFAMKGFLVAFVVMCAIIVAFEIFNDKVHDESTLAEICDTIPVIAKIPNERSGKRYSKYGYKSKYAYGYGYGYEKQSVKEGEKK